MTTAHRIYYFVCVCVCLCVCGGWFSVFVLCFIVIMLLLPPTVFSYLLLINLDFLEHKLAKKVTAWPFVSASEVNSGFQRTMGGHIFLGSCPWSFELSVGFQLLHSITIANWVGSMSLGKKGFVMKSEGLADLLHATQLKSSTGET